MNNVTLHWPASTTRIVQAVTVVLLLSAACLRGQILSGPDYYGIRQWGQTYFDTDARLLPAIDISADYQLTALVRTDGEVFVQGQEAHETCRPLPGPFVDVEVGHRVIYGLRPDGTVDNWGPSSFLAPPPLPPGVTYTQIASGYVHLILLRSDGQIEAVGQNWFGQLNVPPIPNGVVATKVDAMLDNAVALLSNGDVIAWGDNTYGQNTVPALPPGMVYTDVWCGLTHALALRSDGMLVAWGSSFAGELNVPPLPPGTVYEHAAAGTSYNIAWRSDGTLVGWGWNTTNQIMVPPTPPGLTCVQIEAHTSYAVCRWSDGTVQGWGDNTYYPYDLPHPTRGSTQPSPGDRFAMVSAGFTHTLVLRADGTVEGYGNNGLGCIDIPPLPAGLVYTKVRAGVYMSAALRSDGQLLAWGANSYGQSNVPPLPAGLSYVDVAVSFSHVLALRSDGEVIAFGRNSGVTTLSSGQGNVPSLPPGMTYEAVDAYEGQSLYLRSDGNILHSGYHTTGFVRWADQIPPLPAGVRYTDLAAGGSTHLAVRSDGEAVLWTVYGSLQIPQLPWGVYYVEADGGDVFGWLRRSDGEIVPVADPVTLNTPGRMPPEFPPDTSVLGGDGQEITFAVRVGPKCIYVGIRPGCSGSLPTTRLVPRDTPRIGRSHEVTLFDLPHDIAIMAMGWQQLAQPIDLGLFGMPGCELACTVDGTMVLAGQNQQATWRLPIPNQHSLIGVQFYNQALVLDLNASNSFGAVLSDAMHGIVGPR